MSFLPKNLQPFRQLAEEKLASLAILNEIEFSNETYQIFFKDISLNEEAWVFLQFDEQGKPKDYFCSCPACEENNVCIHLAMAFLVIYKDHKLPLHIRFRLSIWNQLGKIGFKRYGDNEKNLKKRKSEIHQKNEDKRHFLMNLKNQEAEEKFRSILEDRREQTEETSIKFSNLPEEELEKWRDGEPSFSLSYNLSFWSDLAKWWMELDETKKPFLISFSFDAHDFPNAITLEGKDLSLHFSLTKEDLLNIIPCLQTFDSPLFVKEDTKLPLEKINYVPGKGILKLFHKKKSSESLLNEESSFISFGKWQYFPKKGFLSVKIPDWALKKEIGTEEIPHLLREYLPELKKYLKETSIDDNKHKAKYEIFFDREWNLHLSLYLSSPSDLKGKNTKNFGEWIYTDQKGFFRLTDQIVRETETTIPSYQVPDFIRHNRSWLNNQKGFQTHLSAFEGNVSYYLDLETLRLSFSKQSKIPLKKAKTKEFGPFIYIEGEGFYPKSTSIGIGSQVRPGISVGPEQIPLFIHANKEDLEKIPKFFHEKSPILSAGLQLEKLSETELEIIPDYEIDPSFDTSDVFFFEEYVYTKNEGFSELKGNLSLPENYRHRVYITSKKLNFFFEEILPSLEPFFTWIHPEIRPPNKLHLMTELLKKRKKENLETYEGKFFYQSEIGKVPFAKIWKWIHQKKRFVMSSSGLLDLTSEKFQWIKKISSDQIDVNQNILFLTPLQLIRLNALEEIEPSSEKKEEETESKHFLQEIRHFVTPLPPDQRGFLSHLRPYQQTGLQWLWFIYQHHLSGLLCDEMGLGKTHQAMGLIASIHNVFKKDKKKTPQSLIICPTSVLYHWKEKIEQFLPNFRVFTFYGTKRSLQNFDSSYDILLTSYGIWRNERENLKQIPFEVAFFDEIQIAKNPQSRIYHALKQAMAKTKIGLTGTPIENHLRELKTLFDLVLPTYMPTEREYREFFIKPIEKEGSKEKKELLARFIDPFVLRRKKKDVLTDLPEKIEEVFHCDLLAEQERLYRQVLYQGKSEILPNLQDPSNPVPYIHIFALLTHLKQICDHPAVFLKEPENYQRHPSGKWELFKELLNEALESEQKVVVYSQYLYMLDIIEMYLEEKNIGYASLRGGTIDRGGEISRFHKDPTCRVFVGSLHAAGLGIDLTAGSVVIHYDRWWNAAKENQATDRVHRIGQKKGVQVFKLITLDTFEERIDQLIKKKQKLLEEIVGIDDKDVIKTFSRDEILSLLDYVDKKDIPDFLEDREQL